MRDIIIPAKSELSLTYPPGVALSDIVRVFNVRRVVVVTIALTALLGAIAYCALAERMFRASTTLLLDVRQEDPLNKDTRSQDAQVETASIESQVQLVTADTVVADVVRRLGLAQDPEFVGDDRWLITRTIRSAIDWLSDSPASVSATGSPEREATDRLADAIKASRVGKTYLVKIDAMSRDPQKAAKIANALARSFMDDQFNARLAVAERSSVWMRRRADELREQSLQADRAMQNYTSRADRERVELRSLEATSQTYRKLYESFLDQYTTTLQTQRFPASYARVVTPAVPPKRKIFPRTTLILIGSLVSGVSLGWLLGFALEKMNRTLRSEDDVEQMLQLSAIGVLPRIVRGQSGFLARLQRASDRFLRKNKTSTGKSAGLVGQSDMLMQVVRVYPRSRFSQTIDRLRAVMWLAGGRLDVKVIGIVSSRRGEGKTVVAANLAQHLALSGARTALLDWNFQNPSLTLATPGGETGPDERRLVIDAKSGLAFLPVPGSQRGKSTSAALTTPAQQEMMDQLRGRFDHICVDLPPLETAMDVRAVSALVDCCVLVCDADQLRAAPLNRFLRLWRGIDAAVPILGFVLNRAMSTDLQIAEMSSHGNVAPFAPASPRDVAA